jgi:hypothetical protein
MTAEEEKIHNFTHLSIEEFTKGLSQKELVQMVDLGPELFGKIWQASAVSSIEMAREWSKDKI